MSFDVFSKDIFKTLPLQVCLNLFLRPFLITDQLFVLSLQPRFCKRIDPNDIVQETESLQELEKLQAAFLRKLAVSDERASARKAKGLRRRRRIPAKDLRLTIVANDVDEAAKQSFVALDWRNAGDQYERPVKRLALEALTDEGETDGGSTDSEEAKEEEDDAWTESRGSENAPSWKSRSCAAHEDCGAGGHAEGWVRAPWSTVTF